MEVLKSPFYGAGDYRDLVIEFLVSNYKEVYFNVDGFFFFF